MIVEGPVKIVMSVREVEKHNIWMRPYLDREGYELLYFGSRGWTPLCWDCMVPEPEKPRPETQKPDVQEENVPSVKEKCDKIRQERKRKCNCNKKT